MDARQSLSERDSVQLVLTARALKLACATALNMVAALQELAYANEPERMERVEDESLDVALAIEPLLHETRNIAALRALFMVAASIIDRMGDDLPSIKRLLGVPEPEGRPASR